MQFPHSGQFFQLIHANWVCLGVMVWLKAALVLHIDTQALKLVLPAQLLQIVLQLGTGVRHGRAPRRCGRLSALIREAVRQFGICVLTPLAAVSKITALPDGWARPQLAALMHRRLSQLDPRCLCPLTRRHLAFSPVSSSSGSDEYCLTVMTVF